MPSKGSRRAARRSHLCCRLNLERLEDRTLPSSARPPLPNPVSIALPAAAKPLEVVAGDFSGIGKPGIAAPATMPSGVPAGSYTIPTVYSGTTDYLASSPATGQLVVDAGVTLPTINPITLPHNQFPTSVALNATSTQNLPLTYTAAVTGDSLPFDLQSQYAFTPIGPQTAEATAYVLHSNRPGPGSSGYYLIRPSDGALFAYDGSGSYAHTFANGTPLGVLGANTFLDPSLLLGASPPLDYNTLYAAEQQYQFVSQGQVNSNGTVALVLQGTKPGPGVRNLYLVRSDGALFAYDGSQTFAQTFANGKPLAALDPAVYSNPALLTGAQLSPAVYAGLYALNQQYDLKSVGGNHPVTADGRQALWLFSPILNQFGQHWYTLTPDGTLRAWQGYPDAAVGATLAALPTGVYANPAWLTAATRPPTPAATATVDSSGKLTIGLPNNNAFAGSFRVTVTVTDGLLSASQTVLVTATDTAPTLTISAPGNTIVPPGGSQSFPHLSFPQDDAVATSDAEGDAVVTTASAAAFSLPFALEQQYRFTPVGYQTAAAKAYVLQAPQANSFGNVYYLLDASGNLYAYDGSGSYAHTFANGTPLAALGAATFNDPALLLGAQAPVDYPTLYGLEQQYQFQNMGVVPSGGVNALVLHSSQPGPGHSGYYLVRTDGEFYAYDGAATFAQTFANATPLANLGPATYVNPSLLLAAQAQPGLYSELSQLMQRYAFQPVGYQTAGATAYVLSSPAGNNGSGNPYYLLRSDGALFAYDGSGSYAHTFQNGTPIAALNPAVFATPSLLLNATAPLAAVGATANVSGGTLALGAPGSFVGTFQVTVLATDGIEATTQTFLVNSTDTPPVPNPVPNLSVSASGGPVQLALGATDAENDPVTFQAQAFAYSAAYTLQQLYHFTGIGRVTDANGVTAYVLHSNTPGAVNGLYVLSSTGGVYASDGSPTFAQLFANPNNLVYQLTPAVYANPALLTNAQPPAAVPASVASVSGNTLTLNASSLAAGTAFGVILVASDGAETGQTAFLVTVTA